MTWMTGIVGMNSRQPTQDLIEKTSTPEAPWYIIPADRKWYRNLVVARLMVEKLRHLQLSLPTPNFDPASIIIPD